MELFHRTSRRALLTSAGEAIVGPARRALRDVAIAQAAVAEVVGVRAGRFDIVALATLAVFPAAELIGQFRTATPDITIKLLETEPGTDVASFVRDGHAELGFAELPIAGDDLEAHELERQDYVAVLPPTTDLASIATNRLTLRSLARLPLITTPPGTSIRRLIDDAFALSGLVPNVSVETDHREAIGPLVVAGAGVSLLPRAVAQDAVRLGAITREVSPRISRRIGIVHRSGPLSPAARTFLSVALPNGSTTPAPTRPRPRRRAALPGT